MAKGHLPGHMACSAPHDIALIAGGFNPWDTNLVGQPSLDVASNDAVRALQDHAFHPALGNIFLFMAGRGLQAG